MRAGLVAILAAALVLVAAGCGGSNRPTYPIAVYIAGQRVGTVAPGQSSSFFLGTLRVGLGHGHAIVHVPNGQELVDQALATRHGRIDLPYTPIQTLIQVNAQKQLFPHASEVTSLSMVLSTDGIDAAQVKLVPGLKLSPPAKQRPTSRTTFVWGDPEQGFVGQPNVAGTKGGFGVYEPEIKRLSAKYGVHLIDLQGKSVNAVQAAVLNGHPVIAWVGGSAAEPASWRTPSGSAITVDLGEHAVVLIGAGKGYFLLNDPLTGKAAKWTTAEFSARWALIGNRALELP